MGEFCIRQAKVCRCIFNLNNMNKAFSILSFMFLSVTLAMALPQKSPHGIALNVDCAVCHKTADWKEVKPNTFNHDTTAFPLTGQHKDVSCKKCHESLIFSDVKTNCIDCHKDIHQQTVGQDCQRCHTTSSWIVTNVLKMHAMTKFPLRSAHAVLDCYSCHKSTSKLRFDPMSSECFDCHASNYYATINPNHTQAAFPKDCALCHNERDWKDSKFDHNTTAFPLKNAHYGVECVKCHSNGYTNTSTECVSCHKKDYDASKNPSHLNNQFSTACKACHNDKAWVPSTFNHNTTTSFPLTGGHVGVDCIKCHATGYVNTSSECVSCHKKDYDVTKNPNHLTAKFSTDCEMCHSSNSWVPSTFNHNTSTRFPLTGGHVGVDCATCHTNGYTGTSMECVSCHLANYNATINPAHATNNFSKECQNCHNANAWKPSTFNHNTSTSFPLTGGHVGVDCIKCHATGYVNTSSECVSCHKKDYDATKSPAHLSSGFSTDCKSCHTMVAWVPSTFNHENLFPIKSGKHTGIACTQCHFVPTNYKSFSCTNCHEHNKTDMDKEHNGEVSGYVYNSTNCYNCHPRGKKK